MAAAWQALCTYARACMCLCLCLCTCLCVCMYVGAVLQARAGSLGPLMTAVAADLGRTLDAAAVRAVRPHVTEAACDRGGTWQRRHVAEAARDSGRM